MEREKKKRMMPRHLLTAAVLAGIVPLSHVPKGEIAPEDLKALEAKMTP